MILKYEFFIHGEKFRILLNDLARLYLLSFFLFIKTVSSTQGPPAAPEPPAESAPPAERAPAAELAAAALSTQPCAPRRDFERLYREARGWIEYLQRCVNSLLPVSQPLHFWTTEELEHVAANHETSLRNLEYELECWREHARHPTLELAPTGGMARTC